MRKNAFATALFGGVALFAALAILGGIHTTNAQSASGPKFLITWSATKSFAPANYIGKILPNQDSQISASVELISSAGKPIDISNQTIYWYLNDNILGGGVGAQHATFRLFGQAPNAETLKIQLPNYPGGILIHEITIPMVAPQAVVDAPYPQGIFSGNQALVRAVPYFFNVSSSDMLGFSWSANNQPVTDATNPQSLQITVPANTPSGYAIPVSLTIQNAANSTAATANITLTYQSHL